MSARRIVAFYGAGCGYCRAIAPAVDRLETQDGITVERLEVWGNADHEEKMEALRPLYERFCGGCMVVPSFYDPASERLICNPGSYERLKEWVLQE